MSYLRSLGGALVAAGLLVALALPAAVNAAGTYVDHECRTPAGAAGAATGFVGSVLAGDGDVGNTCSTNGLVWAGLKPPSGWDAAEGAAQVFTAADGTTISAFELDRKTTGMNAAPGLARVGYLIQQDNEEIESCSPGGVACPGDTSGIVSRAGITAKSVKITVGCFAPPGGNCQIAQDAPVPKLELSRATFTLADTAAPAITAVRGLLAEPGNQTGRAGLEFDATDVGGGLYKLYVAIDGTLVETRGLDQGGGTCIDADGGNADPFEFRSRQPCPLSLTKVPVVIDTEKLPNGPHKIDVTIEDAAGNRSTVFAPAAGVQVLNQTPNGSGADRNAKLEMYFVKARGKTRHRLTTLKGERVVTRGRLVDSRGRGIRGAEIDVYHLVRGKPVLLKTGLKSRKLGRVTLILPNNVYGDKNGLRTLIYEYKAFRPATAATSRQTLRLTVRDKRGRPVTGPKARR